MRLDPDQDFGVVSELEFPQVKAYSQDHPLEDRPCLVLVQSNVIPGSFDFTLREESRPVLSCKSLPAGMDFCQNGSAGAFLPCFTMLDVMVYKTQLNIACFDFPLSWLSVSL